jgi:hypothetical protein
MSRLSFTVLSAVIVLALTAAALRAEEGGRGRRVAGVAKKLNNPVANYYAESPAGGPEWGLRAGITLLFPK